MIRQGLGELQQLAAANKSDDFFATLFRLVQEQLGERLDLPASAITEAVIEEHLRPRGVPEETLGSLHSLFQICNLARYTPIRTSQELAAIIPGFEAAMRQLQALKL
jgi:predicted anti-sigma-YlaC factor YlaD